MSILPTAPFERIIKKAGANRVSQEAANELAKFVEEKMMQVFKEAMMLAKHAGRKTIVDEDVRMAAKKLGLK